MICSQSHNVHSWPFRILNNSIAGRLEWPCMLMLWMTKKNRYVVQKLLWKVFKLVKSSTLSHSFDMNIFFHLNRSIHPSNRAEQVVKRKAVWRRKSQIFNQSIKSVAVKHLNEFICSIWMRHTCGVKVCVWYLKSLWKWIKSANFFFEAWKGKTDDAAFYRKFLFYRDCNLIALDGIPTMKSQFDLWALDKKKERRWICYEIDKKVR